jgi:hypothetical protein
LANKTVTVEPAGGDYTSLDAAIDGELVANAVLTAAGLNGILTISIEGDWSGGADTTKVTTEGFTTDSTHYVNIVTDSSNRAGTSWSDSKYRLVPSAPGWGGYTYYPGSNYTRMTGVQLKCTYAHAGTIVYFNVHGGVVDGCLIADTTIDDYAAIVFSTGGNVAPCIAVNTIVKNIANGGGLTAGIRVFNSNAGSRIFNCTVVNIPTVGILQEDADSTVENCYSGGNTGDDYSSTAGTFTTNFSEDGTEGTSTAAYSTDTFTNVGDGTENLALVAGSGLINGATDLSADGAYPFNWDINNATRVAWDVGADEYIAPAASGQPAIKRFGGVPHMAVNRGVW